MPEKCKDCGKPSMEHASYTNGFFQVQFLGDDPPAIAELSEAALNRIQEIVAAEVGGPVGIIGIMTLDETESRLVDLADCE